jgi:hypothetical protein
MPNFHLIDESGTSKVASWQICCWWDNISGTYNGGAQFAAFLECKYIIGLSLENIEILNHLGRMVFLQ